MKATARTPDPAVRAAGLALVLALHLLLWLGLHDAMHGVRVPMAAPTPAVVWLLNEVAPPAARAESTPPPAQRPAQSAARPESLAATRPGAEVPSPAPKPQAITLPAAEYAAVPAPSILAAVPVAAAAASAASAPLVGSILDSAATRRAIRAAARNESLAERAANASEEPARRNASERLGQEVAAAARGDCLKGEYVGAGMGILSLPFLLVAEARGKCSK